MTLRRQWHSIVDIPIFGETDNENLSANILLTLKKCLVGDHTVGGTMSPNGPPPVPWVVEYSSNTNSNVLGDHWLTVADVAHSVPTVSSRSWACFKSPQGKRVVVDRLQSTSSVANSVYINLYGGVGTPINADSLSPSLAPVFTKNLLIQGSRVNTAGRTSNPMLDSNGIILPTGRKAAFTMSADGEYWFFLTYLPMPSSDSLVRCALGVWPIVPRAGLTYPEPWTLLFPSNMGLALTDRVNLLNNSELNSPLSMLTPSNQPDWGILPSISTASNVTNTFQYYAGKNKFTNEYDGFSTHVSALQDSNAGIVGTLEDIYISHIDAQWASVPATGTIEHVVWGNWLLPFSIAPAFSGGRREAFRFVGEQATQFAHIYWSYVPLVMAPGKEYTLRGIVRYANGDIAVELTDNATVSLVKDNVVIWSTVAPLVAGRIYTNLPSPVILGEYKLRVQYGASLDERLVIVSKSPEDLYKSREFILQAGIRTITYKAK